MGKKIIHIGLHKTATSFLQRNYFPHLKNISFWISRDFYSKFGTEKMHEGLLISGEALSGLPWNKKWIRGIPNDYSYINSFKLSIKNLKLLFPEAHIVIVFRKHGDLLISLYKQYIQEGGILKFDQFYNNEVGVIKDDDLNFTERINFIRENFEDLSVLSFEEFKKEGATYFNRFFESLGYIAGKSNFNKSANKSISGSKINLLRNINKFYPKFPKRFQNLMNKNQLTPRKILQARLRFWNPQDPKVFKKIKDNVNEKFKEDWKNIEKEIWK